MAAGIVPFPGRVRRFSRRRDPSALEEPARLSVVMKNGNIGATAAGSHEVAWAILRLALGLIQITGATTSLLLLIGTGLNRLTISAVVVTGFFTLLSRILFSRRARPAR
jgi:hypothetical protein